MKHIHSAVVPAGQSLPQGNVAERPLSAAISAGIPARKRKRKTTANDNHQTLAAQGLQGTFSESSEEHSYTWLLSDSENQAADLNLGHDADDVHVDLDVSVEQQPDDGARGRYAPEKRWITAKEDFAAIEACRFAERIGRPLNYMLTINDPAVHAMAPKDRAAWFYALRQKLRTWFNHRGEGFTFIMAREDHSGEGEHCHLLFHLPVRLEREFKRYTKDHMGGRPRAFLRRASPRWWVRPDGRFQSAINYLLKGIHVFRAANQNRAWKYAGIITGKRVAWSNDIAPLAIADSYRAAGQTPPEWTRPWVAKSKAKRASNDNTISRRSRLLVGHSEAVIAPSLEGRAGGGKKPTNDNIRSVSEEDTA